MLVTKYLVNTEPLRYHITTQQSQPIREITSAGPTDFYVDSIAFQLQQNNLQISCINFPGKVHRLTESSGYAICSFKNLVLVRYCANDKTQDTTDRKVGFVLKLLSRPRVRKPNKSKDGAKFKDKPCCRFQVDGRQSVRYQMYCLQCNAMPSNHRNQNSIINVFIVSSVVWRGVCQ